MPYLYPVDEYLRSWKILTLLLGILFLLLGAWLTPMPDWDIPVSFIMALCAYVTAAPSMRVLLEHRWAHAHYALFWTWYSVDGCYFTYWTFVDPAALVMRPANAGASLALYGICGLIWYHRRPVIQPVADEWFVADDDEFH